MSSLHQGRLPRKPPTSSAAEAKSKQSVPSSQTHSQSPSRLPVKPALSTRPASLIATPSSTISTARSSRPVSTSLNRPASLARSRHDVAKPGSLAINNGNIRGQLPSGGVNRSQPSARPHLSRAGSVTSTTTGQQATHSRARSTVATLTPAPSLRPPLQQERPAAKQQAPQQQQQRPSFSALQQHYSPAKSQAPKPSASAILAPPSPSKLPANVAARAEASRLQAELLHLHLLHRDAATTQTQWQYSAKIKLEQRFRQLCRENELLVERERRADEQDNMLALRAWAARSEAGSGLEDKIQVLDNVFTGLWTLTDPGGRYEHAVQRFERWIDGVVQAERARSDAARAPPSQVVVEPEKLFAEELDASWKSECAGLARKLDLWTAQLSTIEDSGDSCLATAGGSGDERSSSLARMLVGARALLDGTRSELHAMREMQQQTTAREEAWVKKMNADMDDDENSDTPGSEAVWRTV